MVSDLQINAFRHAGVLALPALFAFEEVAWLREAAIGLALRYGATRDGRSFTPTALRDVHLIEPGFGKLAAHPRLVEPVARLIGGEVALSATRLCLATGFDILANAAGEISAVVFLDVASEPAATGGSRLGSALLVDGAAHYRDPRLSPTTLAFVATFVPAARSDAATDAPRARLAPEPDDCLWPSPYLAFG